MHDAHPRSYLIQWLDKIWAQGLSGHPHALIRQSIRDCASTGDDIIRHQNMTAQKMNEPWKRQNPLHRSTDQYRTTRHISSPWDELWPCTFKGNKGILQAECAYIWHTGQIPSLFSYHFIPIIYLIDVDKRFVRQIKVLTWISDNRQVC